MNLADWQAKADDERTVIGERVAELLGGTFSGLLGEDKLAAIEHPDGFELVLIPGGTFERGVRADELEMMRAIEWQEPEESLGWLDELAKVPTEIVTVAPFLLARAP